VRLLIINNEKFFTRPFIHLAVDAASLKDRRACRHPVTVLGEIL
jgi:hypothetical protein